MIASTELQSLASAALEDIMDAQRILDIQNNAKLKDLLKRAYRLLEELSCETSLEWTSAAAAPSLTRVLRCALTRLGST